MIPLEHSEQIVEGLGGAEQPNVELVVVPDAGHMVLLEKPDVVSAALGRLLRRVVAERNAGATGG
jgi:pimeloyl-ACP methyl ester carboxylesterase